MQRPHPPILLGGGGKGLLRVAAKHADVVNLGVDTGGVGYIAMGEVAKVTDERFRSRAGFLRDCARAAGRDPAAIRLSNVAFNTMLTDSSAQTQERAAMLAPVFRTTPEGVLRSPNALVGTTDEIAAEIRRRAREWGVSQVIFSFPGEPALRRLGETVVPALRDA